MRPHTLQEREWMTGPDGVGHVKIEAQDADGSWRDWSHRNAGWRVSGSRDAKFRSATVHLARGAGEDALSQLVEQSLHNRNALDAYAPAIDGSRLLRVSTCVLARGQVPIAGDFREIFLGRIDRVEQGDGHTITLHCSSRAVWLAATQIREAVTYGAPGGMAREAIIQQLLDEHPNGKYSPTVQVPVETTSYLTEIEIAPGGLFDAAQSLAQDIGWDLRERYDVNGVLQLTLFPVDRARTTVDAEFTDREYRSIRQLNFDVEPIRTAGRLWYRDAAGVPQYVDYLNPAAFAEHGDRWFQIPEQAGIHTEPDAQALLDAAGHDLSGMGAEFAVVLPHCWFVEEHDRYTFKGQTRGVHHDTDQTVSVAAFEHIGDAGDSIVTVLSGTVRVVGAYEAWHRRLGVTLPAPFAPTSILVSSFADRRVLELEWTAPVRGDGLRYQAQYKLTSEGEEAWRDGFVTGPDATSANIAELAVGAYDLRLRSVDAENRVSAWVPAAGSVPIQVTEASDVGGGWVPPEHGGTGVGAPLESQLLVGNASGGYDQRLLLPADIPGLPASKITSGILVRAQGGLGVDASSVAINRVYASPASGAAGAADFRALVVNDLPTVTPAKGGTGLTTLTGANRLLYSTSATAMTTLAPYATANNAFLRQTASGAPAWARIGWADIDGKVLTHAITDHNIEDPGVLVSNGSGWSVRLLVAGDIPALPYAAAVHNHDDRYYTKVLSDGLYATLLHEHDADEITTGELATARGGTGRGAFVANRVVFADAPTSLAQVAVPAADRSYLRQSTTGAPAFGRIDWTLDVDGKPPLPSTSNIGFVYSDGSVFTTVLQLNGTHIELNPATKIPAGALGTGSSIATKFLRGDSTWQDAPAADLASAMGTLPAGKGGTGLFDYSQGDMLYAATNTPSALSTIAPNATANRRFLNQSASGAPVWSDLDWSDIRSGTGDVALKSAPHNAFTGTAHFGGFDPGTTEQLRVSGSVGAGFAGIATHNNNNLAQSASGLRMYVRNGVGANVLMGEVSTRVVSGGSGAESSAMDFSTVMVGAWQARWSIATSGSWVPGVDALYDFGTASVRPRHLFMSGNLTLGTDVVLSRGAANRLDLASGDSLSVLSGTVGISIAAQATAGLYVQPSTLTGTAQYGVVADVFGSSSGTASVMGVYARARSAAAVYTATYLAAFYAQAAVIGAGSTVTTTYGLLVASQAGGSVSNFAIYTNAGVNRFGDAIWHEGTYHGRGGTAALRTFRNLAVYTNSSASLTGALVIKTGMPGTVGSKMCRVRITGRQYSTSGITNPIDLTIWWYKSTTGAFTIANGLGGFCASGLWRPSQIRMAVTPDDYICIIIDDIADNHHYAKLIVDEFLSSHSGAATTDGEGWSIANATDLTGYTQLSAALAEAPFAAGAGSFAGALSVGGALTSTGHITAASGTIYSTNTSYRWTSSSGYNYFYTPSGYIALGPANTSYAHLITDRPDFWFNQGIVLPAGKRISLDALFAGAARLEVITTDRVLQNVTINASEIDRGTLSNDRLPTVAISKGGTGAVNFVPYGVVVANSGATELTSIAPGNVGNVLKAGLSGAWEAGPLDAVSLAVSGLTPRHVLIANGSGVAGFRALHKDDLPLLSIDLNDMGGPLNATKGGTGLFDYSQGEMLYAASNTPAALTAIAPNATANRQFLNQATSGAPVWSDLAWSDLRSGVPTTASGWLTDVALLSGAQTIAGVKTFSSTIAGSISGNAATATVLQTARTINGVSFNGSANITVAAAAGTLTGTALPAAVVTSSLTAVGTIATGVWQGTAIGAAYGGTGTNNSTGRTANTFFGGPTSGAAGAAAWRLLHENDIPALPWSKVSGGAPAITALTTSNVGIVASDGTNWSVRLLVAGDIPALPYAAAVHTHDDRYYTELESDGRFAALVHYHDADEIQTGTLNAARVPTLDFATKTSGLVTTARGGTGVDNSTGGTAGHVWARPAAAAGAATYRALVESDIPTLTIGTKTTGTLAIARGGTGVTSVAARTVLIGPAAAGAPTWRVLEAADIPALPYAKIIDPPTIPSASSIGIVASNGSTFVTRQLVGADFEMNPASKIPVNALGTGAGSGGQRFLKDDGTFSTVSLSGTTISWSQIDKATMIDNGTTLAAYDIQDAMAKVVPGAAGQVLRSTGAAWASAALAAGDIPALDTGKITTGTFVDARIPALAASKVTSGVFATARLGTGTASASTWLRGDGTWQALPAQTITSVFGRTGAVVAAANDYTFAQIGSKPTDAIGYGITNLKLNTRDATDLNSRILSGFYQTNNLAPNTPYAYTPLIVADNQDVGLQLAGGYNSDNLYFRGWYNTTTFTAWRTVLHSGNIATYSGVVGASRFDGHTWQATGAGDLTIRNNAATILAAFNPSSGAASFNYAVAMAALATVAGALRVGTAAYTGAEAGDLVVSRNSAPTSGVLYFGSNPGNKYLYFDGSNYSLAGGTLNVGGNVFASSFGAGLLALVPDPANNRAYIQSHDGSAYKRIDILAAGFNVYIPAQGGNAIEVDGTTGYLHVNKWLRHSGAVGTFNTTYGQHWFSESATSQVLQFNNATGLISMRNGSTGRGSLYFDNGGFGLLDHLGHWGVRINHPGSYGPPGGTLYGNWGVDGTLNATTLLQNSNPVAAVQFQTTTPTEGATAGLPDGTIVFVRAA